MTRWIDDREDLESGRRGRGHLGPVYIVQGANHIQGTYMYPKPRMIIPASSSGGWEAATLRGPALGHAVAGAVVAAVSNVVTYPLNLIADAKTGTLSQRKKLKSGGSGSG